MGLTCRQRCLRYLQKHPNEWVCGGTMQRLAVQHSTYTPSNVSRRLRELAEECEIEVKREKGVAWYRWTHDKRAEFEKWNKESLAYFDALPA